MQFHFIFMLLLQFVESLPFENFFFILNWSKKKKNKTEKTHWKWKETNNLENKANQHKIGNLFKFQIIYEQNDKKNVSLINY